MVELPEDIAEDMANRIGIYGTVGNDVHPEGCKCRTCFVSGFKERIRDAVEAERRLSIPVKEEVRG